MMQRNAFAVRASVSTTPWVGRLNFRTRRKRHRACRTKPEPRTKSDQNWRAPLRQCPPSFASTIRTAGLDRVRNITAASTLASEMGRAGQNHHNSVQCLESKKYGSFNHLLRFNTEINEICILLRFQVLWKRQKAGKHNRVTSSEEVTRAPASGD